MKRYAFFIVLGVACFAVGFSSYRFGRDRAIASAFPEDAAEKPVQAVGTAVEAVSSRPAAELISLKEKLKHSYTTCPSAQHDWILRGQTAAVLATMTTAELKSLLEELLSCCPQAHYRHVTEPNLVLITDLLREWGRKDPVAACRAMADAASTADGRMAAFQDWLLRDPSAVTRWMASSDEVPSDLRRAWLSERVKTDPRDAIHQLAGLPPESRASSLIEWSSSCALLPAERKVLLEAVQDDPALLLKCAGRIAGALVDQSVQEAYGFVDSLDLDEEMATSLDDGIFAKWSVRDPQVAFAEWAKQKETRVPDSFLNALDTWSLNSPGAEQAIEWLDTVEAGPAKEKIQVHFIEELTDGERFEQAVRMGMSMDNREEGKRQVLRTVTTWKEKFPDHARERLAAMTREDGVEVK
ncbi:hypothetical protein [Luteolibacter soli]|uniref:HEAT repeat domain-containing protein n=1 Tax=Luteolibacter soli TaxID=3135280 RepID=A0ABU9B5N2_9BACT